MPIPLIPIVITSLFILAAPVISVIFWKKIYEFWKGKYLVILGTTNTGKSTLHDFFRKGTIRNDKKATKRERNNANIFQLEDLELVLKEGIDLSGQDDFLAEWAEEINKSDMCFYLFRTDHVYNKNLDVIEKVYTHLKFITDHIKNQELNVKLILIGTFSDLVPEFEKLNESNFQEFEEIIRNNLKEAIRVAKIKPSKIFIGSLKNEENAERLAKEILVRLKENS